MSDEELKVIYIRAGTGVNEQADLAGLIGRIMRAAITTNNQRFVLQLAPDQSVLTSSQAWRTLKQVSIKQGLSLVVAGGTTQVRELANGAGFPLIGTADMPQTEQIDLDKIRTQVVGFTLPEELGGMNFEVMAEEYRRGEPDSALRTIGGFIEFTKKKYYRAKDAL